MNEGVAITGWGAVSALGVGRASLWPALRDGKSGVRAIERFSTEGLTVHRGGCVPGYDIQGLTPAALCDAFAWQAAEEALEHAGHWACPFMRDDGPRAALVFGTSIIVDTTLERPATRLAKRLALGGPVFTVSTACTSSTYALGLAYDLLLDPHQGVDVVLAGGADVLTIELLAGFHALGVLTPDTCTPFGETKGTSLGEGAGFVVLERRADAAERSRATLLGYGLSGDAYHETSPEPRGRGVTQAANAALHHAQCDAGSVGYANLHGTGTEANDPAECAAMRSLFGVEGIQDVAFSSSKGHLGHAQGAAGVLELISTLEALEHGHLPGTAGLHSLRPSVEMVVLRASRAVDDVCAPFLSCNSAFAGSNAALVAAYGSKARARQERSTPVATVPELFVRGAFSDVADSSALRLTELRAPPRANTRGQDRATRLLLHGVHGALCRAGLALRGDVRERTGLFVGMLRPSPESSAEFRSSLDERGAARPDVSAFARLVLNAAVGAVAKTLTIRGPESSLVTGRGSGLAALYAAARLLQTHDDVDQIIVAAVDVVDVVDAPLGSKGLPQRDGVAAFVLSRHPPAPGETGVRLTGLGVAGPHDPSLACSRALRSAALTRAIPHADLPIADTAALAAKELPASAGLVSLTEAVVSLMERDIESAYVVSAGGTVSVSAMLEITTA